MPLGPCRDLRNVGLVNDRTPSESAQPPTGEVTTHATVATAGDSQSFPAPQ